MGANTSVYFSYFIFISFSLFVFFKRKASDAIILTSMWGWMFLPNYQFGFLGFPELNKVNLVTLIPVFFCFSIYFGRFVKFKFSKFDLPIIFWILSGPLSSMVNQYSLYDSFSVFVDRILLFGLPYFLARIFLNKLEDRKYLMEQFFLAAAVYLPLCWFEMRFSPQLHNMVYGFHPHNFIQSVRSVGWRPVVFMKHGLLVALFMLTSSIISITYIRYKIYLFKNNIFYTTTLAFLFVVTVYATQSYYAFIKLSFFLALSVIPYALESRGFYFLFTNFHFFYVFFRVNLLYTGESLVRFIEDIRVDPTRVKSTEFRFAQENQATAEVLDKNSFFGLHSWISTSRTTYEFGRGNFVFDSNWILVFRTNGLFGLFAYLSIFILPVFNWCFSSRKGVPREDLAFLTASVGVFTALSLHNIMNTFDCPLYFVLLGAFNNFYIYKGRDHVDSFVTA